MYSLVRVQLPLPKEQCDLVAEYVDAYKVSPSIIRYVWDMWGENPHPSLHPGVAQFGRAPALGAGCRMFKSCHLDQYMGT